MNVPSKVYEPQPVESKWYQTWLDLRFFEGNPNPSRKPYSIVIPPPNVTGVLHMGHMLNNTIQDVLIRRKRMQGYETCWVPGIDHASIATEAKVVEMLRKQGIDKKSLTREQFLEYAWAWKEKYGGIILEQLKKLGASCDWRRSRFTMEPTLSEAVIEVFCDLYEKGYIYRGVRMINWDPKGLTALSDEEVIYKETQGKLYYVLYPIEGTNAHQNMNGGGFARQSMRDLAPSDFITIATTRPETIFADTAIAVNPEDERYRHLIGKHAILPLHGRRLPIIADAAIDPTFGTGCLKVTPAHDLVDYEIALRHNVSIIELLNPDGTINEHGGFLAGKDRFEARTLMIHALEQDGYISKIETNTHKVGHSERTDAVIEPRLSLQWFLKMEQLAAPALKAVIDATEQGVRLIPDRFINTYKHWMENVRDWCISRQLWWGHRIPAYYLPDGSVVVAPTREKAFLIAQQQGFTGSINELKQDEDVLDTWFSSWLWPISVFDGFKDPQNPDIQYFYPTDDLVTAPEILFFWVARMIMAGYEYRQARPFKHVYLTGIVRDKEGRKMSKQLGNSPDPLVLIEKYGADGVRMGMLLCSPAGNDLLFDESLCEQGRNFTNKLWNAFRLLQSLQDRVEVRPLNAVETIALAWMPARFRELTPEINRLYDQFRLSDALMTTYKLFWDDFCAWFLEIIKPSYNETIAEFALSSAFRALETILKLFHPFTPFITEEIWHLIAERKTPTDYLIVAPFPQDVPLPQDFALLQAMTVIREVITQVRAFRNEKNIPPKQPIRLFIKTNETALFTHYQPLLIKFCNLEEVGMTSDKPAGALSIVVRDHELYVPLSGAVDVEAERAKIETEIQYTEGFLNSVLVKLQNEKFVANAKPEIVAKERQKLADAEARLAVLRDSLKGLL